MKPRVDVIGAISAAIAAALIAFLVAVGRDSTDEDAPPAEAKKTTTQAEVKTDQTATPVDEDPDEVLRNKIIGTWRDDYEGTRTMVIRPDGTSRMTVELEGWRAAAFAAKSHYNREWKIEDGLLTMHITDGEPASKIKWVIRIYGDTFVERIEELTADQLVVVDVKSGKKFTWQRLADETESASR